MGQSIIKLDDKFCEWSTITDAPVTMLLSEELFKKYWRAEYGISRMYELPKLIKIVNKQGTSSWNITVDETIKNNRAGKNETPLSKAEIIQEYSLDPKDFNEWIKLREEYQEKLAKEFEEFKNK